MRRSIIPFFIGALPLISQPRLAINLDDCTRTMVCAPEDSITAQARELLTADYEEAWIGAKGCYYEVGREAEPLSYTPQEDGTQGQTTWDTDFIATLYTASDTLRLRHTHPFGDAQEQRKALSHYPREEREAWGLATIIDGSLPNDTDIEAYLWLHQDYNKHNPAGVLESIIDTPYGTTTMTLTPEGRAAVQGMSEEELLGFAQARYDAFLDTPGPDSDDVRIWLSTYTQSLEHSYLRCTYTPYADLAETSITRILQALAVDH